MKYDCDLVKDLLPLYQDGVCSETSTKIVKEHLEECTGCREIAGRLANQEYDRRIQEEREDVIGKHMKKEKRRSFLVGVSIAGILMIPVVVCLICNIAIGHSLDWFFIVLTALMVTASLTVVPLVAVEKRGLLTLGCFTLSLLLLLLTINIYVRGTWFPVAAVSVLLGLSVFGLPFVICQPPVGEKLGGHKGLIVMLVNTLLLYGLIFVCCGGYRKEGFRITSFCLLFAWVIFLTARYLRADRWVKAGMITIMAGTFTAVCNEVVSWITGIQANGAPWEANLYDWSSNRMVNANCYLLIWAVSVAMGAVFILAGVLRRMEAKRNAKNENRG